MRWSRYFLPTSREAPKDAETVSHKLMCRAGLIDKLSSGVYTYLPAGLRVLKKVENIVREEMNSSGAVELLMPAMQPASLWQESGRLDKMGDDMIRFTDRHKRDMLFGPTHEEVITSLVKKYVNSWKQLPVILYQIQTKYRDEIRPRFGVIRSREFLMKDAYSFDMDEAGLDISYNNMKDAYKKIFAKCGLKFSIEQADSGVIGGKFSEEFVAAGECSELEIGHIFKLGTEYSRSMNTRYVTKEGKESDIFMGCYGIGVSRIIAASIEGNHDEKGIIWPLAIAPFNVLLIPVNTGDPAIKEIAEKIYGELTSLNIEVLVDDRQESIGSRFSDADLTGIPLWIVAGKKVKEGKLEIKIRNENRSVDMDIPQAVSYIKDMLADA